MAKGDLLSYIKNIIPDGIAAKLVFNRLDVQWSMKNLIVATAVSQTTDFGELLVDDRVRKTLVADGTSVWITITVKGDLGEAAVVGDTYEVWRNHAS